MPAPWVTCLAHGVRIGAQTYSIHRTRLAGVASLTPSLIRAVLESGGKELRGAKLASETKYICELLVQ